MSHPARISRCDSPPVRGGEEVPRVDRRDHLRIRAIGRVGRIETGSDGGLCRIHDLSDGGMMIETTLDMQCGEQVRLSVDGEQLLKGHVVWRQGFRMGIQLEQPVDCCELIRSVAQAHYDGRGRQPRLKISAQARGESAIGPFSAQVIDISQSGLKIRHEGGLPVGLEVEIHLTGGIDARGVVRWSKEGMAGIQLSGMIAVERLASASAM